MRLWEDWGLAPPRGAMWGPPESGDARRARENRWRRAWILSQGKKAVRRWVEERDKDEGDGEQ